MRKTLLFPLTSLCILVLLVTASQAEYRFRIRKLICQMTDTCPTYSGEAETPEIPQDNYAVAFNQAAVTPTNASAISFTISNGETGDAFTFSIDDTNGSTAPVTGSGIMSATAHTVAGLDLSALEDGTLTLSAVMTHAGETSRTVTATITKSSSTTAVILSDSFAPQDDLALNNLTASNVVTISGFSGSVPVSVSGAGAPRLRINGGNWTQTAAATSGASIQLMNFSADLPETTVTTTFTAGGTSVSWPITTTTEPGLNPSEVLVCESHSTLKEEEFFNEIEIIDETGATVPFYTTDDDFIANGSAVNWTSTRNALNDGDTNTQASILHPDFTNRFSRVVMFLTRPAYIRSVRLNVQPHAPANVFCTYATMDEYNAAKPTLMSGAANPLPHIHEGYVFPTTGDVESAWYQMDAITITPIASQYEPKNTPETDIAFTVWDAYKSAGDIITAARSSNQTLVPDANLAIAGTTGDRTLTITPANNRFGVSNITVSATDGRITATQAFEQEFRETGYFGMINCEFHTNQIALQYLNEVQVIDQNNNIVPFTTTDADFYAPSGGVNWTGTRTKLNDGNTSTQTEVIRSSSTTTRFSRIYLFLDHWAYIKNVRLSTGPAFPQNVFCTGTTNAEYEEKYGTLYSGAANPLPHVHQTALVTGTSTPAWHDLKSLTVSDIADQYTDKNTTEENVAFTVYSAFRDEDDLVITAHSDNQSLIPDSGLVLGGSGASRTISLTPNPDQWGKATITITVSDGVVTTTDTFQQEIREAGIWDVVNCQIYSVGTTLLHLNEIEVLGPGGISVPFSTTGADFYTTGVSVDWAGTHPYLRDGNTATQTDVIKSANTISRFSRIFLFLNNWTRITGMRVNVGPNGRSPFTCYATTRAEYLAKRGTLFSGSTNPLTTLGTFPSSTTPTVPTWLSFAVP